MRHSRPWSAFLLGLLSCVVPVAALAQTFAGDFSLSSGAVYQTAAVDDAKAVAVDTFTAGGPYVYVTGDSDTAGATVKLSSAGVALASAPFISGGTGWGHGVAVDPSGNVWVVGHTVTAGPVTNWVVQKNDANLVPLASSTINGVSLGDAVAAAIVFDASGNAFVTGYSSNSTAGTDFRVVKYSPSLVVLASATFGGNGIDQAFAIALDTAGNVLVAGSGTPYNYVTVKFNSSLVQLSSVSYDAAGGSDQAYGVATDPSGNVYVTGYADSGGANYAFTTVKYNSSLAQQAVASYNTGAYDAGFGATFVGTTTLVVVGSSQAGATEDWVILEYDTSLTQISSRAYDSGTSDRAHAVAKGTGIYMYVAGISYTSPSGAFRTIRMNSSASSPSNFAGCAVTNDVGAGQTYATIQSAVNALPSSLTGHSCVVIRDGATYAEQVTVRNFANNGYTLKILADPGSGLTPVVAPPAASTAAFLIANASVNIQGISAVVSQNIPYGVWASSAYVHLSSVSVSTSGSSGIYTAGVRISSWSAISNSTVAVWNAHGIWLDGSEGTALSYSTATSRHPNYYALYLLGADSNTVTGSYFMNSAGHTGFIVQGSDYNTISQSTVAGNLSGFKALIFGGSSFNTITGSYITNPLGYGLSLSNYCYDNTVTLSTITANSLLGHAFDLSFTARTTITQNYIANTSGTGLYLFNYADSNTVSQNTMVGGAAFKFAFGLYVCSSNTITQNTMSNPAGWGAVVDYNSNVNTLSQNTISNNTTSYPALYFKMNSGNTVSLSTITAGASAGLYIYSAGSNTFSSNYIQGSTAAHVFGSTGVVISGGVLVATNTTGSAVQMNGWAMNLTLSSASLSARPGGAGIYLGADNSGQFAFTGNTIAGARYGMLVATQAAGAGLSISSMTFSGLTSGATAIEFLGGTFVSTFAAVNFDATVAVNVNAALLNGASRITMSNSAGARTGPTFENDPSSLVDWVVTDSSPTAPSGFAGTAQSTSSIQWSWTDNSADETGFRVKLGVTNLSGDLAANTSTWLQTGLTPNATSGSLLAQAFNSTGTADSSSLQRYSLTDPPNSISATFFGSSVAFTWPTMTNPPGTRWSVERGTDGVSYAQLYFSSAAAAYTDNTGMSLGTSYYYRIRAANGDTVYSAHANASAIVYTGGGPSAPSGFAGTAQSTTSILWSWTDNASTELGFRVLTGTTNVSGDLAANTTTWLQTGLGVNTSSGSLLVQVFNSTGTANSGSLTRYSLAAVPTGLGSSGVTGSSATISWSGSATLYQLERSTGAGYTIIATTPTASYGDTGLTVASTYYYRVLGLNGNSIATAYASTITVVTLPAATGPAAPSAFAGTAQTTTSILWNWTDNATTELGFRILAGTVNVSGNLAANTSTWLQSGLGVNTSSGSLLVQAFNSTGTANSSSLTRYSLAAVPTGLASSTATVFQSSATLSWTSVNPAGTIYELERSTGGGFALEYSSVTAAYTDTALAAASTYYYRVRALNADAISTAYSSSVSLVTKPTPLPSAPTGFAGTAQSTASILWSWADNATNEIGYRVMSGAANISGDLPASTTLWLQSGFGPNVSTGPLFAQAFNVAGGVNSGTASRATWAAVPSALAPSGVAMTSVTLTWNAGGNPGGTLYELERSTGAGYGLQLSSTAVSYFDQYLTPGATHYYRVRAVNVEAVATAYSSTLTVVALPAPPIPGSAGTPVGAALGTSSVSWTWALASGATNHFLYRASDNSYLGSSPSGPFVLTALTPNEPSGLRAAGVNVGGTGPLSPSATVYTLAMIPSGAGAVASTVTATTLVASWGLNGNAASTLAQLDRSTTGVVYSTLAASVMTSYTDADLLGCTTYYYRVRNANGNGLLTAYASFQGVTGNTVPSPPAGLTAAANGGGTVSLSWNLSPTEGVTGYQLFWDSGSGTVNYGAALAVFGSTATAYTSGVLTSSAAYTFALRAAHRCGVVETTGALAMSGAAVAPPALRAAIKEPDSGKRIHGNRVTILGELIYGTPSDAQQVLFQYKLASSTAWLNVPAANVNHSNPDFSFPYYTHWNVNLLAPGDYDLRAVAYNTSGVPDSAPPAVRVTIVALAANADISENDDNGEIQKDQTISNLVASVVDTAGAGATDPAVRVTIPAGAVTSATATISVTANPVISTAPPAGQSFVGSSIKIDLSNGQSALNGTAAITLTYPSTVLFPSLLQIFYLNEITGQWSRDFNSTVDTASRTVTGNTPHFSTFALMLGTSFAADLDSVQVYPVPFKPNGTNPDEGRAFSAGNANSGIFFANLMMGSEIKIYTLTGRLVASLDNAPVTGTLRWDARNQDGRDVASGAYFAVIKAAGRKSVVKKLVIIR